jgi:XXXCH domain-containing protein
MPMSEQQQHEFKLVKRRLSAIQLAIKADLKNNQLPQVRDVTDFVTTSEEMDDLCQNEWRSTMDDYIDRLKQFQTAMAGRDLEAADNAFHELLNCKVSCHKEFRQK